MRRAVLIIAMACALFGCATPQTAQAPQAPPPLVVLVSIDGFRPDYLERGLTPRLSALAQDGVSAAMRPSFPSLTFPNHYTLVTGLRPDRNGIVNNQMEDPDHPGVIFTLRDRAVNTQPYWWEDATPIWVSAEQQGVATATMFWPGSEVAIHDVRPTHWLTFDQTMPSAARADQLLAWLAEPAPARIGFATLYFDIVDTAGHRYGVQSNEVNQAIAEVDAAIGRLIDGLAALHIAANIVVVSDHGMVDVSPQQVVDLDQLIAPTALRYVWPPAQVAGIEPLPDHDAEVRAALIGAHDHVTCWAREAMPARFHAGAHRRVPPIVCMADVGWTLLSSAYARPYPVGGGAHGYDPDDATMAAMFIASGPDFRAGATLPVFDNVDVYPLLTQLLRIEAHPSDGDASVFQPTLH